jgi:hypothetical protein
MPIAVKIDGEWLYVKDLRVNQRRVLTEIGELGKRAGKARAPIGRTRNVYNSIDYKVTTRRVKIGVDPKSEGWYGRLVEMGHALVKVVGTRRGRGKQRTRTVKDRRTIGHVAPHPFFFPAMESVADEFGDIAIQGASDTVEVRRYEP